MDRYTKRFLFAALLMMGALMASTVFLRISAGMVVLAMVIGYFSIVAIPAKLFAEEEARMPSLAELARYPILWALIFTVIAMVLILVTTMLTGNPIASELLAQLIVVMFPFAAAIGAIGLPLFVRLYLR